MIDHQARAEICEAIDGYLTDRLTAFAFDERLSEIGDETKDSTAHYVINSLWFTYDDCDDHLVNLDKESWDTIQRLLLVLRSGAELHTERSVIWHVSQLFAAACLVAIAWVCCIDYRIWPIPVVAGGLVSMALSQWRGMARNSADVPDPRRVWPFRSISAIARAVTRADGFRKRRHRPEVAARQIRSSGEARAHWYMFLHQWLIFSPVPLAFQCLPLKDYRTTVRDDC